MLVEYHDEQKHAQKLNYLYCKHCYGEKYPPKKQGKSGDSSHQGDGSHY